MTDEFLEAIAVAAERLPGPRILPWPEPGRPDGMRHVASFAEWRDFFLALSLRDTLPLIVTAKYARAQKLHVLAWLDFDLIKAGELVALTALELALKDRYGGHVKDRQGNMRLPQLLRFMPERDGLTDDKLPMIRRYGGSVVPLLLGERKPSLADIRNTAAHGDPFDGMPWAGLLELIRDLIEYAYRDWP